MEEKNNFDGKIQPTCIICFDDVINDASKLAAQYFRVPIIMIQKHKYKKDFENKMIKYNNGQIDKFDNQVIDDILLSPIYKSALKYQDNYELCLSLCNKALSEGIINNKEYYERLCYMHYVIAKTYDLSRKYIKDDLRNRIEEAKISIEEDKIDGIRR